MHPLLLGVIVLTASAVALRLHYLHRIRGNFSATRFLWSRGLALLCDHHGGTRFVKDQVGGNPQIPLDPAAFQHVKDGDLVWMRATSLPQFLDDVLPIIRARFTLVTGDEDWSIPSGFERANELLDDPRLLCWFAQNLDGTCDHPKLHPLPIGLDFHSLANSDKWDEWPAPPALQEAQLRNAIARSRPNRERLLRVHADFHFNKPVHHHPWEHRESLHRKLAQHPDLHFPEKFRRRSRLWRRWSRRRRRRFHCGESPTHLHLHLKQRPQRRLVGAPDLRANRGRGLTRRGIVRRLAAALLAPRRVPRKALVEKRARPRAAVAAAAAAACGASWHAYSVEQAEKRKQRPHTRSSEMIGGHAEGGAGGGATAPARARTSAAASWLSMQNWPIAAVPSRRPQCCKQSNDMLHFFFTCARSCNLDSIRMYFSSHGVLTALAGSPATLMNSCKSSGLACAKTSLNDNGASHSCVTAKAVPNCTADAPMACKRAMSSRHEIPPAAIKGI
jgi:hypothetical protein